MTIQARVDNILDVQGESVTYKRVVFNRDNATLSNVRTTTDYSVKAHIRLFEPQEIAGMVSEGDRQMRIAADALPIVPRKNDIVVVNSQQFNVVFVDRRTAYGTDALYILQIRGQD